MHTIATNRISRRRGPSAFTLIEILIVVVILGILAAITVPQFADAADETADTGVARQLQMVRGQIELYRNEQNAVPDLIGNQWTDMISNDYLTNAPVNTLNGFNTIGAAPALGVGWVWRDKGNGTLSMYATDRSQMVELSY